MVDQRRRGGEDADRPLVSVIFPALDAEVLERACDALFYDTDWPESRLDAIVTDHGLSRAAPDLWTRLNRHPRVRMISVGRPDDVSATFHQGVRVCGGDVVVLIDGVPPPGPDWLGAMAGLAMRADVGAVLSADPVLTQASSDVRTGCVALRREVLEEVRDLDKTLAPRLNDLDLCLRLQALGYRIAWRPQASPGQGVGP